MFRTKLIVYAWISFLWMSYLCFLAVTSAVSEKRVTADLFNNATEVQNSTVECDSSIEANPQELYASNVWICRNIRINGKRLESETGFGHSYSKSDKDKNSFTGKNDIAELCRTLLRKHGIYKSLWAAYAVDVTRDTQSEPRLIFVMTMVEDQTVYTWQETAGSRSYIGSIKCMVMDN